MQTQRPSGYATTIPAPARDPKRCACGRVHDSYAWAALPYVGIQEGDGYALELRNCPCRSTLAVQVPS